LNGNLFDKSQSTIVEYLGNAGSYTIPSTVTSLGFNAFGGCNNLTNVTIPTSVTNIGFGAFSDSGLSTVVIPNSVISIGKNAFVGCQNLTTAIIGTNVNTIGNAAFQATSLTNIIIPNSVTSIGGNAFAYCGNFTTALVGNGVTNIGDYAFIYDENLEGVYFLGNAPAANFDLFFAGEIYLDGQTVYYLANTTGWGASFSELPTATWNPWLLQVTIFPATALPAGAQWEVDGSGQWQNSGATVNSLSAGNHTVSYSTIPGWTAPAPQTVLVGSYYIVQNSI
jgi:hypothetical protein